MEAPIYKRMSKEEIDEYMKKKISTVGIGNTCQHVKGSTIPTNAWDEDSLMIRNGAVWDLMGQGMSRSNCVRELMARWGVSYSTAHKYCKEAFQKLNEGYEDYKKYSRDLQIERLENIISSALAAGKHKEAVMGCQELDKLLGLNVQKVEVEGVDRVFKFGGE